jgi:ribonuclease P protein subunit POP4
MKVTPDIIRYEFVGTNACVARSAHADYVGVCGEVIGETKNCFTLQGEGKIRKILKQSAIFNFTLKDGTVVEIDGKHLVGRSEDRLKKNMKRLW